jgi:hypothetical protein
MPGNERQPFACSINRRGLSDDEKEKSHNWRHTFISAAYIFTLLDFGYHVFNQNCRKTRPNKIFLFLKLGVYTNIYDSPQNSWSHTGDNEVRYIMRA